jgi:hypothetical protein
MSTFCFARKIKTEQRSSFSLSQTWPLRYTMNAFWNLLTALTVRELLGWRLRLTLTKNAKRDLGQKCFSITIFLIFCAINLNRLEFEKKKHSVRWKNVEQLKLESFFSYGEIIKFKSPEGVLLVNVSFFLYVLVF